MYGTPINIAVFTGSRADYGLLVPIIKAIHASENAELQLLVGGSHMLTEYGHTIDEIKADGFPITATFNSRYTGTNSAKDMAETAMLLTSWLDVAQQKPDIIVVLGDRHEAFAVASAALMSRLPIAHIHGGDVVQGGMLDEPIRHAITKMAHLHFPATKASGDNILAMGEEMWRVNVSGAPAMDNMKTLPLKSRLELANELGVDPQKKWILFTQHPITLWPEKAGKEAEDSLHALTMLGDDIEVITTGPNQDEGSEAITAVLEQFASKHANVHFIKSLGRINYLNTLKESHLLMGNSSSGLIESAFFGIPTINIGDRQLGRERGENVIDVMQEEGAIFMILSRLMNDEEYLNGFRSRVHPFGDGNSAQKTLQIILSTNFNDPSLLNKQLVLSH